MKTIPLLARIIYLFVLAIWMGTMVYFSFFATPEIFRAFPRDMAGRIVGALFPAYYKIGMLSGFVLFITSLYLSLLAKTRIAWASTLLVTVMFILTLYGGLILHPEVKAVKARMHQITAESPEYQIVHSRFRKLHGRSMLINVIVLITGAGALLLFGVGPR